MPFLALSGGLKESVVVLPFTLAALYIATWGFAKIHSLSSEWIRPASVAAIIALVSALAIDVPYSIFSNVSNGAEGPAADSLELR